MTQTVLFVCLRSASLVRVAIYSVLVIVYVLDYPISLGSLTRIRILYNYGRVLSMYIFV